MRKALVSLAAITLMALPCAALANWQYTTWSMTPEQVMAAAPGHDVMRLTPEEQRGDSTVGDSSNVPLLKTTYSSGDYQFTVVFSFNKRTNHLSSVELQLENLDRAPDLMGSMHAKYGKPASDDLHPPIMSAVWYVKQDQVTCMLFNRPGSATEFFGASVRYAPRNSENSSGL